MRILERYIQDFYWSLKELIIRLTTKCLVISDQPYVCKQKHSAAYPFLSKIMVTSSQGRNLLPGGVGRVAVPTAHERYSTPTPNSETSSSFHPLHASFSSNICKGILQENCQRIFRSAKESFKATFSEYFGWKKAVSIYPSFSLNIATAKTSVRRKTDTLQFLVTVVGHPHSAGKEPAHSRVCCSSSA